MEACQLIKDRRSIRKYKSEKVSKEVMNEIIDMARYAPSWANYQIARYTVIYDQSKIDALTKDGVHSFGYNMKTLKNAPGVVILSYVMGKSGKLDLSKEEYTTAKKDAWEVFDAGIACQTFCLAAHAKGVGTCIFGVIDDEVIARIANLPENQQVAALITFGYPDEEVLSTPRKSAEELVNYID